MNSSQKDIEQKKPMTKNLLLIFFFKFRNRQNQSVMMEIRKVVACGGWEITGREYKEMFWDNKFCTWLGVG